MKIAFATIGDVRDIRRGSGTPYYLWQELKKQGCTVHLIGPVKIDTPLPTRFLKYVSAKSGKKYVSYLDPFVGKVIGKKVSQTLVQLDYDIILTNDYCIAGYTQTKKPIILYTDAFFPHNYSENIHPWLANLSSIGVYFYQRTTARGIKHAYKCFFASQYAMEEAKKYKVSRNKAFSVIPYGANIEQPINFSPKTANDFLQKKGIDLLFIGKDWKLKGGDVAVKTARVLNERGINACLNVVGIDLSDSVRDSFVKFYGLLNKDSIIDRKQLEGLFSTCDVLIVPSKAEGYGLVFVEAAAYGLPSLAYKSSGVMTAVQDGRSGILFALAEDEIAFANQIEFWYKRPEVYANLSNGARRYYEQTANWKNAVKKLIKEMEKTL
ncbi:MAG: glycosyltransferase family 4 protein [Chloroflexi bacterium]|nr:glycosyltransferase family 4 protein [Chloroflexota bacterium]